MTTANWVLFILLILLGSYLSLWVIKLTEITARILPTIVIRMIRRYSYQNKGDYKSNNKYNTNQNKKWFKPYKEWDFKAEMLSDSCNETEQKGQCTYNSRYEGDYLNRFYNLAPMITIIFVSHVKALYTRLIRQSTKKEPNRYKRQ